MITGITDKKRFPRLGKIRLGEKKISKGGAEYPSKLPHFNLVDAPAVQAVYGDKPTVFAPVLVPANPTRVGDDFDFSSFWKTSKSAYGRSSGLFCRCSDGVTATRVNLGPITDPNNAKKRQPADPQGFQFIKANDIDVDVGDMFDMPCPADECWYFQQKRCKNIGSFDFMLPSVQGFGTWCIQTSSFNSIRNIESALHAIAHATGGVVAGIPLVLKLIPQQAQVDGKGVEIYVLELICPYNLAQIAGMRRKAIAAGGAVVALIDEEATPDDLFPHGGAALDADLGKGPTPAAPTRLEPEAGKSRLDALAASMKPGAAAAPVVNGIDDEPPPPDDDEMPFGELRPTDTQPFALRMQQGAKPAAPSTTPAAAPAAAPKNDKPARSRHAEV